MKTKYWVILVRRPPATWEALPGEWGSKAQAERYAMDEVKGQWAAVPVVTAREEADGAFRVPAGLVREGRGRRCP